MFKSWRFNMALVLIIYFSIVIYAMWKHWGDLT